ncbi:hypothetical protein [Micromonospora inyonensis]|nr:hypothetical protein [Micromonospora inyonensis]
MARYPSNSSATGSGIRMAYAQPVSRITRLIIDDIIRNGDQVLQ